MKKATERMKVLLVDDHEVVHWGFRTLLSRETWVGGLVIASTGAEALALARRHRIDVAIVDLFLAGESGAELCPQLREASPRTRILLMSGGSALSPQAVRRVGASGFVPKSWSGTDVAGAARMVGLGMTIFPRSAPERTVALSEREREIVALMARGSTNAEIAAELFLSRHTVKDHTTSIYRKLGARNRAEAVLKAELMGFLSGVPEIEEPVTAAAVL